MYAEDERWDDALPIYEMLGRKAQQIDKGDDDILEMYLSGARAATNANASDKALDFYKAAYDIDSTNRDVLSGLADVNFETGDQARAFKLYQTILVQHRDSQSDEETVLVYHRLGAIKQAEGEHRKALRLVRESHARVTAAGGRLDRSVIFL